MLLSHYIYMYIIFIDRDSLCFQTLVREASFFRDWWLIQRLTILIKGPHTNNIENSGVEESSVTWQGTVRSESRNNGTKKFKKELWKADFSRWHSDYMHQSTVVMITCTSPAKYQTIQDFSMDVRWTHMSLSIGILIDNLWVGSKGNLSFGHIAAEKFLIL